MVAVTAEPIHLRRARHGQKAARPRRGFAEEVVCQRVAIYCRISQDRRKDELGVDRQEELCQTVVDRLGWTATVVVVENDATATRKNGKAAKRPEYQRLMAMVREGEIDGIVTYQQDRLLREPRELEDLIDIVEQHGIEIRGYATGLIDLSTAAGRMNARNLANYSKFEGELKGERLAASVDQHRRMGMWPGGLRPFGYHNGGAVHEDEAPVLQEVARRLLAGESVTSLAHDLNRRGFTTTRGKPWSTTALKITLSNPRMAGWSTHYGERIARGQWEPLWDDETHEALVAQIAYRTREPSGPRSDRLLGRDLLRCGKCGRPMVGGSRIQRATKGQRGEARPQYRVRTYVCPRVPEYKATGSCGNTTIDADPVDRIVVRYVEGQLRNRRFTRRLRERQEAEHGPLLKKLHHMREQLAGLNNALSECDPDELTDLRKARKRKQAEIAAAEQKLAESVAAGVVVDLPAPGEPLHKDIAVRRRQVGAVLSKVTILPPKKRGGGFDPERVLPEPREFGGAK